MILIALGANLPSRFGAPEATLKAACDALERRGVSVVVRSSIWISAPVPVSEQPWYRNAVIVVETSLDAPELLNVLKAIEVDFGREGSERDAARLLDLDIIAYNDEFYETDGLTVPHARAHERGFVLYPLQEVCPDWIHPVLKLDVAALISDLPEGQRIEKSDGGRL